MGTQLPRRRPASGAGKPPPFKDDRVGPWLDNLEKTCGILAALSDGLNIPIMKSVVGVAIEVLKVSQTVRSNRESCQNLAMHVAKNVLLLKTCRGCNDDDMTDQSRLTYETLLETLQELREIMEELSKRPMLKRIWHSVRDEKKIVECKERINDSLMAFVAQNHVIQALHRSRIERDIDALRMQVRSLSAQNEQLRGTVQEQHQLIDNRLSGICTDLKLNSTLQTDEIQKLSASQQSFHFQLTATILFDGDTL